METQMSGRLDELVSALEEGIRQVKDMDKNPSDLGIGKLFRELQGISQEEHTRLMALYKPVSVAYFKAHPSPVPSRELLVQKELLAIQREREEFEDEYVMVPDGEGGEKMEKRRVPKGKKQLRLPRQPKEKKPSRPKGERDRSVYCLDGVEYGKGGFVLAVVSSHSASKLGMTVAEIKTAFPDTLLRGYGIVQELTKAVAISGGRPRYFMKDVQRLNMADGVVVVCNQFTSDNIGPFMDKAKVMGFNVEIRQAEPKKIAVETVETTEENVHREQSTEN